MIHFKSIYRIIGFLLFIEAAVLLVCAAIPLLYREQDFFAFVCSTLCTACGGMVFYIAGKGAKHELTRRDGYIVVSVIWVLFTIFGSLPYIISRVVPTYSDAFFETMAGFTTTGGTVMADVESLPHGILFWRSLTQWIGGLGIIFFTVAVLPLFGVGNDVQLFAAEAVGPTRAKIHPRIGISGRWILFIYLLLTSSAAVVYWICGMNLFDAVNHALTTLASGGFSTKNASIGAYGSPLLEYAVILFMFMSGINFTLLYFLLFKGKVKDLFRDTEFKFYFLATVSVSLLLTVGIACTSHEPFFDSLRESLFHVTAIITTTGFATTNFTQWHPAFVMVLGLLMYVGSCAGSTSGSMKSIRIVLLFKLLRNEFYRILHPNAIKPVKINNKTISSSISQSIMAFTIFYVLIIFAGWLVFIVLGMSMSDAYAATVSLIGNIGVATNGLGDTISWNTLTSVAKIFGSLIMLVGRLEIFPVLLLLSKDFWNKK